jgi:hypothetical protein
MNEQKAFLMSLGGMACSLVLAFWQNYIAFALCGLSFAVGVYFMFVASALHVGEHGGDREGQEVKNQSS